MLDNNIDKVFKQKIGEISQIPENISWDKESSWNRLKKKRKQKLFVKIYYYAAAIIVLGLTINQVTDYWNADDAVGTILVNSLTEYEKRQKLAEMEGRMSGNYYRVKLCSVCDDFYYQLTKEDRPVQFLYFETN